MSLGCAQETESDEQRERVPCAGGWINASNIRPTGDVVNQYISLVEEQKAKEERGEEEERHWRCCPFLGTHFYSRSFCFSELPHPAVFAVSMVNGRREIHKYWLSNKMINYDYIWMLIDLTIGGVIWNNTLYSHHLPSANLVFRSLVWVLPTKFCWRSRKNYIVFPSCFLYCFERLS